jgi:hypothetical protein
MSAATIRMDTIKRGANSQHLYYVDGDPLVDPTVPMPGCSTVAGFVDKGGDGLIYWGIDQYIASGERNGFVMAREGAGALGTQLHSEIEYYIINEEHPQDPSMLYSNWYASVGERVERWVSTEKLVYHGGLGYGGTTDCIGIVDGVATLFDWKSANFIDGKGKQKKSLGQVGHASQLGGYLLALEYMGWPAITQAAIVYVARDTTDVEWQWVDIPAAEEMFLASLQVYKATRNKAFLKGGE